MATPIADDFATIAAALAKLGARHQPEPDARIPSPPSDRCDDEETAEAYLLWCGAGI